MQMQADVTLLQIVQFLIMVFFFAAFFSGGRARLREMTVTEVAENEHLDFFFIFGKIHMTLSASADCHHFLRNYSAFLGNMAFF